MFSATYLRSRADMRMNEGAANAAFGAPADRSFSFAYDVEADDAASAARRPPEATFVDQDTSLASNGSGSAGGSPLKVAERQQRRAALDVGARGKRAPPPGPAPTSTWRGVSLPEPSAPSDDLGPQTRSVLYAARAAKEEPPSANDLASWPRSSLESRVRTLERLLADAGRTHTHGGIAGLDGDLSHHLEVTVRKNRELRAEIEVLRSQNDRLLSEREEFARRVVLENERIANAVRDAERARETLGALVRTLAADKDALGKRVAELEAVLEAERERSGAQAQAQASSPATPRAPLDDPDFKGNLSDVAIINEALQESLRALKQQRGG